MPVPSSVSPVSEALPGVQQAPADLASSRYDPQVLRRLMQSGSKTFFAASLMLPPRVRAPATALYAYCRLADDAIDLGEDPHLAMLGLRSRLDAIYDGRPGAADADRALCQVVHRFAIPREPLDALLEGFLWDAQGRRYETLAELQAYGARVAGTVGVMMALLMGARGPRALARAAELGVAMQLTNIARDIGEDARNGRLYLPREWLREEGVDADAWLREPVLTPAIARCTQRLLNAADLLYARAEHGLQELPMDCRPAIQAARVVYAEIGRQLERQGLDAIRQRAVVSSRRKLTLIALAAGTAFIHPQQPLEDPAPLAAVRFLVDAVLAADSAQGLPAARGDEPLLRLPRRSFDERMAWAADLHARLLERDEEARMPRNVQRG